MVNPKLAGAYVTRAACYGSLHKYDKEIDDCTKAIALDPKNGLAYDNRAFAYKTRQNGIDGPRLC